jgi:hypothetical protein
LALTVANRFATDQTFCNKRNILQQTKHFATGETFCKTIGIMNPSGVFISPNSCKLKQVSIEQILVVLQQNRRNE